ncbi:hypothetical protein ABBQ38_008626 [Trebouxia sp. C0009 RCD-2024]
MQAACFLALLGLLALSAPAADARQLKQMITDADILNFALNLECLEAQFYHCAVYGTPLSEELTAGGPAPIGCQQANFTNDDVLNLVTNVAQDEMKHVAFLRNALGNYSVQCPLVDIGPAFAAAANAALGMDLSPPFSPYTNDLFFLHGAFIFEDVGVTAYKGAAPLLQDPTILSAAAGILAVEAYHAGYIRTSLIQVGDVVTPYGVNVTTIVNSIAAIRDMLDGTETNDEVGGIFDVETGMDILAPVDDNAIVFSRTPAQVLAIVYLGSSSKPGGFYPNGINGKIQG